MIKIFKKILLKILNVQEKSENVLITGFSRGLQNVKFEGKNAVPDGCNFSGNIKIGYATTLGYSNFLHGYINIGKYCQFGTGVAIYTKNHPTNHLSTYINKNLFEGELKVLRVENNVAIGNDVWIGHNAIIVGGVTIGNGVIIGAGAVVTKDIGSYSVVAGVPAKVIKKRFSESIIKEIEALKWWDLPEEELEKIKPLFFKDFKDKESIYE
ncbi:CatB-related O-acetyltransferase [Lutibacter sp.]|uniref:CatB-related O-acetyltransferase n=1 Tax=Lutibacter sp. TaxID=1925666 RepID=UPI0025BDA7DE|nr:CatB-related O-acetyltransferase [Lutibacter sp.]